MKPAFPVPPRKRDRERLQQSWNFRGDILITLPVLPQNEAPLFLDSRLA